jgi:hypothetical protein
MGMSDAYLAYVNRMREKQELAEMQVLGTAMTRPKLLPAIMAKVEPGLFRREAHRTLADAIWALHAAGQDVTYEALLDWLTGHDKMDVIGGPLALHDIQRWGDAHTDACDEMLAIQRRRHVVETLQRGVVDATNPVEHPDAVVAEVLGRLRQPREFDDSDRILTTDELLAQPVRDWLIDGIVPQGLTVLFGAPKAGKSYVALRVAWTVATGVPFYRRRLGADGTGRVLYLAGEGVDDMRLRTHALVEATDVHPGGNLMWWTEPLALTSQRDAAKLRLTVEQSGAKLVVVDTWTRLSGVRRENDAGESAAALRPLEDLCHQGVSVLVVHHAGASGERARGSTVLDGAAESLIQVNRRYEDPATKLTPLNEVRVRPWAVRRGTGFQEFTLRWFPVGRDAVLEEPHWNPPVAQGSLL